MIPLNQPIISKNNSFCKNVSNVSHLIASLQSLHNDGLYGFDLYRYIIYLVDKEGRIHISPNGCLNQTADTDVMNLGKLIYCLFGNFDMDIYINPPLYFLNTVSNLKISNGTGVPIPFNVQKKIILFIQSILTLTLKNIKTIHNKLNILAIECCIHDSFGVPFWLHTYVDKETMILKTEDDPGQIFQAMVKYFQFESEVMELMELIFVKLLRDTKTKSDYSTMIDLGRVLYWFPLAHTDVSQFLTRVEALTNKMYFIVLFITIGVFMVIYPYKRLMSCYFQL